MDDADDLLVAGRADGCALVTSTRVTSLGRDGATTPSTARTETSSRTESQLEHHAAQYTIPSWAFVVFSPCWQSPALLSACGGIIDPSKNTVDTFTGTLAVLGTGTDIQTYSLSKSGEVEVTMTSVTPTPTSGGSIGSHLGQVLNGGNAACSRATSAPAIVNRKVQFGVLNKGHATASSSSTPAC